MKNVAKNMFESVALKRISNKYDWGILHWDYNNLDQFGQREQTQ